MGNKLGRRRQVVDEKYTKPQGLYQIKDVDYKKLRKLILESKLAPCYPGGDECACDILEECPICFLYFPTLNRSRCCMKSICTECFLQMKNPCSTRPTQCPFCKTENYAVEYRGVKSKEERGKEQMEEQKVTEAKIRMRQEELMEEEKRQQRTEEISSSNRNGQTEHPDSSPSQSLGSEEIDSSHDSIATQIVRPQQNSRQNRDDEADLDLEDIMVMEAIWLSIQENERSDHPSNSEAVLEPGPSSLDMLPSSSGSSRRTKRVQKSRRNHTKTSSSSTKEMCGIPTSSDEFEGEEAAPPFPLLPPSASLHHRRKCKRVKSDRNKKITRGTQEWEFDYGEAGTTYCTSGESSATTRATAPLPQNSKRVKNNRRKYPQHSSLKDTSGEDCEFDHGSVIAEAGTTYGSSNESDIEGTRATAFLPPPVYNDGGEYLALPPPPIPPQCYGWWRSTLPSPVQ